jgi:surface protein
MKKIYMFIGMALFCGSVFAQTRPFITTWNTENAGSTNNQSITIPASGEYSVTWSEIGGSSYTGTTTGIDQITLSLPEPGTYQVALASLDPASNPFIAMNFGGDDGNGIGDTLKLTGITQWGDVHWDDMLRAFYHCSNLEITATDIPDLSVAFSASQMFQGCRSITTIPNIGSWNMSNISRTDYMFAGVPNFNDNINNWDMSAVTVTNDMFDGATSFNQPLNNWDVSQVTNMDYMFAGAESFNQPLDNWNVGNVTRMVGTFFGAKSFNQNIDSWDVHNVTDMSGTFANATAFNQPLNSWDVSSVTDMGTMFGFAPAFNQPLNNWNVANVTNMNSMFYGCTAFNQDINSWDVHQVTDMTNMFRASGINSPLNNWDVTSVTSMGSMFNGATAFNQPLNSWDVSNVTSMVRMFRQASSFNQSLGDWNLSAVTNVVGMLDTSGLDCQQYDNTLLGWAANSGTPSGLTLGAHLLGYDTPAQSAHDQLTTSKGWTISDAGLTAGCAVALPIQLISGSFNAEKQNGNIVLSWSTASESNNKGFSLQRSTDGANWTTLSFISSQATGGNSSIQLNYHYSDADPAAGRNYYRLLQEDNSGKLIVSGVVSLEYANKTSLKVYPNPAHGYVTFSGLNAGDKGAIYTAGGRQVQSFVVPGTQIRVDIHSLAAGIYFVSIKSAEGGLSNTAFIIK